MDKDIVFITGNPVKNEERVPQLDNRTLVPLEPVIDIIAVKVDHDNTLPFSNGQQS